MKTKNLDIIGFWAAFLCLIHCLVFPLLVIIPMGVSHNPYIDLVFLIVGAVVVKRVTKNMESKTLKLMFWTAIVLIAVSVLMDLLFHFHSPLIYIGAVLLIIAHILNFRRHRHV